MITMYDELESCPKYDSVNSVPISELQAFASAYGINHVHSIRFPESYQYYQGCILKPNDIYVVYLKHNLPRQCVARNQWLEKYQPDIIECLERLLMTDGEASYFLLIHEIGHKELGQQITAGQCYYWDCGQLSEHCRNVHQMTPYQMDEVEKKLSEEWEKRTQLPPDLERAANNWAIAELKKLKAKGRL